MVEYEVQQFICGAALLIVTLIALIAGFKVLHGPDYRKDSPPDETPPKHRQ